MQVLLYKMKFEGLGAGVGAGRTSKLYRRVFVIATKFLRYKDFYAKIFNSLYKNVYIDK